MPAATRRSFRARVSGVTRIETLIAVGLLLSLAGVVAPVASKPGSREQVDAIVSLCSKLERAVFRHYVDTRATAIEFSGHASDVAAYHQLSYAQGNPRWNGPYLDEPLTDAANPCGGSVWLYSDLKGGVANPGGFDPKQIGRDTVEGAGQFVAFSDVSEDVASWVDRELDGRPGVVGWRSSGRCEYDRTTKTLSVLLLEL